uniref:Uncharacterized protein n=1 Tax=Anguilla anguilla TaxID=7936 RepID=A0A0E9PPN7_ANGAN
MLRIMHSHMSFKNNFARIQIYPSLARILHYPVTSAYLH